MADIKSKPGIAAIIIGKMKDGMKDKMSGLKDKYSGAEGPVEPGPEGSPEDTAEDKQEYEVAAEEILAAIEEKSASALAEALHAFFQLCEAEPHEEGEHLGEESAEEE